MLVLFAASVLLVGCSETSGSPGEDQGQTDVAREADEEYDLDQTGAAAAQLLGGNGVAAYAVLKAFDSGFSPYQIAYAIGAGLIDESGDLGGLTPAWAAGNVLASGGDGRVVLALAAVADRGEVLLATASGGPSSRADFEQMFAEIEGEGQAARWLVWVLGSTGAGYSVGQITQYLGENEPFTELSPPTSYGVPVILDEEGNRVAPVMPVDWAYNGRNILAGLQEDPDLDFDASLTALAVGMVNAGYSEKQIRDAWITKDIGLCATQGGTADAEAAFSPCWIDDGEVVPPRDTTALSPTEILIEDAISLEQPQGPDSPDSPDSPGAGVGPQSASLRLTPYISRPDTDVAITSHNVVMKIEPAGGGHSSFIYRVSGSWRIEAVQVEADQHDEKGATFVLEGTFFADATSLERRDIPGSYSYTAYTPDGQVNYEDSGDLDRAVYVRLDEDFEGDGFFGVIGPIGAIHWDTYPVDE